MRAIGLLILAAFLAGPGARAHCFLSCADVDRAAAPASCHDDAADGPGLAAAHDCAETGPAVMPSITRGGSASAAAAAPSVFVVAAFQRAASPARISAPFAAVHSPHCRFSIPLRR